jgi:hypothetical protein
MFGCQFIFHYFLSLCLGAIFSQINFFQPNSTQICSTQLKIKRKQNKTKGSKQNFKKNQGVVAGPPQVSRSGSATKLMGWSSYP